MGNGTPCWVEKISPRAGLEPGTSRSLSQPLTHRATEALVNHDNSLFGQIISMLLKSIFLLFSVKLHIAHLYEVQVSFIMVD